jgi:hypothetical protein
MKKHRVLLFVTVFILVMALAAAAADLQVIS